MKIGVIAVQGAFIEHEKMLAELGISSFEIRQNCDLNRSFDGFIIPGGESTVQGKLLKELNLFDALKELIKNGLPVFGTCAGLILLAKTIENERHAYFRTMDITARRNAYGRQLGSFHTTSNFKGIGDIPMTFIRAPYIQSAAKEVEILATVDGKIVAAKQKNQLVTAFHPELDHDPGVHRYFADMIKNQPSL
ncbi:pyridoxal 5'-phosphate synthase glutaminase subunit PdxT [Congzhengia sp.]|uniref:pyridoxal 5'-phosphate synthase glutaminase subunit PdxT n=1 Tax=Congzhengia sp. TaxID=2944168 RepID=UPI003076E002